MTGDAFLSLLQSHTAALSEAVATKEGDWIVKGFIDIRKRIYSTSVDTKIVSKVLELLLFPIFEEFAKTHGLSIELAAQQNHYPDLTFLDPADGTRFAVDVKSTYRKGPRSVNGMTLGAFTGYFRKRDSVKNTLHPYGSYAGHFVSGVIYSRVEGVEQRSVFDLADLEKIPSVIRDFQFFCQSKYRIASTQPGSGNTRNIGSVKKINDLVNGNGPFSVLGEQIFDDYWMHFLNEEMAKKIGAERPYTNLQSFKEYKERGIETLREHAEDIARFDDEESQEADE